MSNRPQQFYWGGEPKPTFRDAIPGLLIVVAYMAFFLSIEEIIRLIGSLL